MVRINYEAIKKLSKKGSCVLVAGALGCSLLLTGCDSREVSTNGNTHYDIIDTTNDNAMEAGIQQIKEVPGHNFKLVIDYNCELQDGEKWTVTSDKKLNMEIRTDGLPEGIQVYIDNVHTDTTICSKYPTVDGITQDTMDDRIHNAQMVGFPIADDVAYVGINQIEGQNETFISGAIHGFQGYSSGTITEKRFKESDYLSFGVYANKITSIIDLIIVDGDKTDCVSVASEVQVSVWPFIQKQKSNGEMVYVYYYFNDSNGKVEYKELNESEYLLQTEVYNQKKVK